MLEQRINALKNVVKNFRVRQGRDPEIIRIGRVETAARCEEYVLVLKQLQRERLIVNLLRQVVGVGRRNGSNQSVKCLPCWYTARVNYCADQPPSTGSIVPVIADDCSVHKNNTKSAT